MKEGDQVPHGTRALSHNYLKLDYKGNTFRVNFKIYLIIKETLKGKI